jgi:hypothetical protein
VLRLDLATLRWEAMPGLVTARSRHACCAMRGKLVVLGGVISGGSVTSSVEIFSSEDGSFVDLLPLSCGRIGGAAAIAVEESDGAAGQVLLLGGLGPGGVSTISLQLVSVQLVDLATGVCTPGRPDMLRSRDRFAFVGLPDGRIVCAGGFGDSSTEAEMWGPPVQGAPDAAWTWRELPAMTVARFGCRGCVMSDGRFAVLGGWSGGGNVTSSCEALEIGVDDEHWAPLLPMHDSRYGFACAAVAGCIIVNGGYGDGMGRNSAEVYDETLGQWLRLPCNSPHACWLMGSALL